MRFSNTLYNKKINSSDTEFLKFVISIRSLFNRRFSSAGLLVIPDGVCDCANILTSRLVIMPKVKKEFNEDEFMYNLFKLDNQLFPHGSYVSLREYIENNELKKYKEQFLSNYLLRPLKKGKIEKDMISLRLLPSTLTVILKDVIPNINIDSLKVNVYWCRYGSISSYMVLRDKSKIILDLLVRDDASLSYIIEGILSGILFDFFNEHNYSWLQREKLIDFLMTQTKLSALVKDFSPTIGEDPTKSDNKTMIKLYKESQKYLKSIGYQFEEDIQIIDRDVYIDGKRSSVKFTKSELAILRLLITNREKVVDYYRIGNVLWDDPDKFSLWAISRLIYKIKFKLKKSGFPVDKLQNVRGEGYQLDK